MKIRGDLLAQICKAKIDEQFCAGGVSVDSRFITPGDIFFPVKCDAFDGHDFIDDAFKKGAILAIVSNPKFKDAKNCVFMQDSMMILRELGLRISQQSSAKVIAITGSVGKTTTKSWISTILSGKNKVIESIRNYNNRIGVPVCLTKIEKDTNFGVFEIGSNNLGEISELSEYISPDIAVITNIKDAHIGNFESFQNLFNEKISIKNGLKAGGTIVFDSDSVPLHFNDFQTVSFGFRNEADVKIIKYEPCIDKTTVFLEYRRAVYEYIINAIGKKYVAVSANVFAILVACKIPIDCEILRRFSLLTPLEGRGKMLNCKYKNREFVVIDDAYNASPTSLRESLDILSNIAGKRKIAILGEMKELGVFSARYHKEIGKYIGLLSRTSESKFLKGAIDKVFFFGDLLLGNILKKESGANIFENVSKNAILEVLSCIKDGDIVLLKGSYSIGLCKFLEFLDVL
jgi:UDP-N-acetylmuramoyl-tripeptide--D-alanyl-D-alanine ligase